MLKNEDERFQVWADNVCVFANSVEGHIKVVVDGEVVFTLDADPIFGEPQGSHRPTSGFKAVAEATERGTKKKMKVVDAEWEIGVTEKPKTP